MSNRDKDTYVKDSWDHIVLKTEICASKTRDRSRTGSVSQGQGLHQGQECVCQEKGPGQGKNFYVEDKEYTF